ncbi:MAG: response regulator transcription factor [Lentimicrobium sp.]|nr:response regulator transcription factor [Lentimicrobium sp.]
MKVLIADDSVLILERLRQMLCLNSQVELVGSYHNGNETLEALKVLKPDIAIVDIKMPGLTGLEVLKEIRKENSSLKFIILTFHATGYHREMALNSGADYFFSKVDDFEKVSQVITELTMI